MKIRTDRLALLAYYLPSIPKDQFSLVSWQHCAIGWATKIPEFVVEGFKMTEKIMPAYKKQSNWTAVEKFFGLTKFEAEYLFSMFKYNHPYITAPIFVAQRINKFIQDVHGV